MLTGKLALEGAETTPWKSARYRPVWLMVKVPLPAVWEMALP